MASIIEDLIGVLQQEYDIYKELIPIAEKKTKTIVKNDLSTLHEIIEQEQLAIDRINALEKKREEVIVNMVTVINRDPSTLNLKEIVRILEKQPKEQVILSEVQKNLKSTIQRLMEINSHNKSLIDESLEMIEFNLNFIQSTRMSPGNNNYNKGAAAFNQQPYQTGMFDAKK